jgi:hypothetical protein
MAGIQFRPAPDSRIRSIGTYNPARSNKITPQPDTIRVDPRHSPTPKQVDSDLLSSLCHYFMQYGSSRRKTVAAAGEMGISGEVVIQEPNATERVCTRYRQLNV